MLRSMKRYRSNSVQSRTEARRRAGRVAIGCAVESLEGRQLFSVLTVNTTADANAWPTPRSWEMASNVLCGVAKRRNALLLSGTSEFEAQLLDGTVGEGAASELIGFLRQFRQLPSIDEILLNPATARVPTETSAQIAVATALGRVMTDNSLGRGLTYLDRMPTEMCVMAIRDAAARETAITHTPEFIRFGVEYREVVQ